MTHQPCSPRRSVAAVCALTLATGLLAAAPSAEARPHKPKPQPVSSIATFSRTATLPAYANVGVDQTAVAEISTITPDGKTVIYTDAAGQRIGFVDVRNASAPKPAGIVPVPGEPTSVYATGRYVLVCVDQTAGDFPNPKGSLLVFDAATRTLVRTIDLGGQPDSIDVSPDGRWAAIAIENQRDEEAKPSKDAKKGDLPQAPGGWLASLRLDAPVDAWTVQRTDVSNLPGMIAASDPEPEYVKFSPDGTKVALTLQENNHIVIADVRANKVLTSFSAGTTTVTGIDTAKDGVIDQSGSITDVRREPDSIGWIDNKHVATANEGDWVGGTRGWTIFDAASGEITWDAGNTLEREAIRLGHSPESRAAKKGIEPEGLAVATFGRTRYAFVGSERANLVFVYDVTSGTPRYLQALPSTNGPEGLLPVPGRNMLVVSSETDEIENNVRATVQLYTLGHGAKHVAYPQIAATTADRPWGALGSLTADPHAKGILWSATDSAFANTRILMINANVSPAAIVDEIPVTKDGKQASYDVEGLWRKRNGTGFWLGVEGATGAGNMLVEVDGQGRVLREVALPESYTAKLGKQGIEGVAGSADGKTLFVAMQREAAGESVTRIGRYDVATGEWTFYGYQLESTDVAGDWMGLSEIQVIDADTVAVIERDKLNGPAARVKRIYTVDLVGKGVADGQPLPVMKKRLLVDVLPALRSTHGWTQEKLEGFTIDAGRNLYVITDNDGLKDATGETVFLNLGKVCLPR